MKIEWYIFKQLYKTGRRDKEKTILKPYFGGRFKCLLVGFFFAGFFFFQLRNISESTSV